MYIAPINSSLSCHPKKPNKVSNSPSFKAQLFVTGEAEDLIRVQAYEKSKGDTSEYVNLVKGFGLFMEDLSNKLKLVKPENQAVTVDLHPLLKEFMELPPLTRGTYTRDQMCILLGWPFTQESYRYFPFTYRPGDVYLSQRLCDNVKTLIKNA